MSLGKQKYLYGADIDGRGGVIMTDYTYYSDISGEELDGDELYYFEEEVMSLEELKAKDTITITDTGIHSELLDYTCADNDDYDFQLSFEFGISSEKYEEIERNKDYD